MDIEPRCRESKQRIATDLWRCELGRLEFNILTVMELQIESLYGRSDSVKYWTSGFFKLCPYGTRYPHNRVSRFAYPVTSDGFGTLICTKNS